MPKRNSRPHRLCCKSGSSKSQGIDGAQCLLLLVFGAVPHGVAYTCSMPIGNRALVAGSEVLSGHVRYEVLEIMHLMVQVHSECYSYADCHLHVLVQVVYACLFLDRIVCLS